MILRSPYPDVETPRTSLPDLLFGGLTPADSAKTALIDAATGHRRTYGELVSAVDSVATALVARGIRPGEVAALVAPNSADYPVVFHGVLRAGGVLTPANPLYSAGELAHQFRDSRARFVFVAPMGLAAVRAAVTEPDVRVEEIIVLGPADLHGGPVPETAYDDLLATPRTAELPVLSADDLAVLPYSSGTTGVPKGVMLTHGNLGANLLQMQPLAPPSDHSNLMAVIPFFHIAGLNGIMNLGLYERGTLVTLPRFQLAAFLGAIEQFRITYTVIVPPIAVALMNSPLVDSHDLGSLELVDCVAAPLDTSLAEQLQERLGATVIQGYGLTESSPCTHGIPVERPDIDRGTIGVLMPSVEARIVDPETGNDVAPGERGELWCRGPNIMRGYLNNPIATANAVDQDGFLHTGDIVTVDADGVFRVVDRLKELIKYKGYQVAPAELEAVLLVHPGIADVAVIGVSDAESGESPKAFVVRHDSHPDLDADGVKQFVAARVAHYKKIRHVEFVEQIPKSAAGKILRKELRSREAASLQPTKELT
ncbi:4-coumarate--CoA ligase family protein [Nocardioides immobilis]|uniref:4-coumarate--CoA ligase family protein n=1 Tax=Nocardioides immobilis TaxID=2049295 RepID=A0A417XTW9_9ACTN|nr:AMP-binding protein [Nocardioides immobilis]RHW23902.1 4-coumarate--CoA ligase family protein [Nocardioides immobilis]